MQALLDDMLDLNRTKLGLGINIAPTNVDLAKLFADEQNLVQAAHPDHRVELEVVGDVRAYGTADVYSSYSATWS